MFNFKYTNHLSRVQGERKRVSGGASHGKVQGGAAVSDRYSGLEARYVEQWSPRVHDSFI
jgi:hypothetical protein